MMSFIQNIKLRQEVQGVPSVLLMAKLQFVQTDTFSVPAVGTAVGVALPVPAGHARHLAVVPVQ